MVEMYNLEGGDECVRDDMDVEKAAGSNEGNKAEAKSVCDRFRKNRPSLLGHIVTGFSGATTTILVNGSIIRRDGAEHDSGDDRK